MNDSIEKTIDINAPLSRVWDAVSDYKKFGEWFQVRIDQPFASGGRMTGKMTIPGYENLKWNGTVVAIEPPKKIAFSWITHALDPEKDYTGEPETYCEFLLKPIEHGTRLTIVESGFSKLPANIREETILRNKDGWAQQAQNVKAYVERRN
ncbi:MAG: SRPBCC family protein [Pseudomonadota bacterium]